MAFIGSAIVQPAIADAELRCQGALVRLGMTRTSVWRWTYEVNGATHVLVFEQDKLKSIQ